MDKDIKSIVREAVIEAIKLHNNCTYNDKEAATYLRISRNKMKQIRPYVAHSIVGGRYVYTKADLDNYIRENRIEAKKT